MIPLEQPPKISGKGAMDALHSYLCQLVQILNINLDELEGRLQDAIKEDS